MPSTNWIASLLPLVDGSAEDPSPPSIGDENGDFGGSLLNMLDFYRHCRGTKSTAELALQFHGWGLEANGGDETGTTKFFR